MKCPYCGNHQAEPPKCGKCYAAIEAEKPKTETPKKSEAKTQKGGKR